MKTTNPGQGACHPVLTALLAVYDQILTRDSSAQVYVLLLLWTPPPILTHPSELSYLSTNNPKEPQLLPKLADPATVELSVIVPAFNETERLPAMLDATVSYLEGKGWQNLPTTTTTAKTTASIPNGNGNGSAKKRKQPSSGLKCSFEIIIVDDGSTDSTSSAALSLA
jgi:dolichyl-phosphate beta-glucosyltransferase